MFRTRMEQHSPEQPGPYDVTAKVAITQPVQNDHRTESWTSGRSARNRRSAFSFDRFELGIKPSPYVPATSLIFNSPAFVAT